MTAMLPHAARVVTLETMEISLNSSLPFAGSEGDWATAGYLVQPVDGLVIKTGLRPLGQEASKGDEAAQWLIPNGNRWKRYPIGPKRAVAADFERLARIPTESAIAAFAGRWGWLDKPVPLVPAGGGDPVVFGPADAGPLFGERLGYWKYELLAFADRLEVLRAIEVTKYLDPSETIDTSDAGHLLRRHVKWTTSGGVRYLALPGTEYQSGKWILWPPGDRPQDLVGRFTQGDVVAPARFQVLREINDILRKHVHPAVPAFLEEPVVRLFPETLLGAIYFRFALDEVGVDARSRPCDGCPNVFTQTHRKRRFCSDGCRQRYNYHQRRARKVAEIAQEAAERATGTQPITP